MNAPGSLRTVVTLSVVVALLAVGSMPAAAQEDTSPSFVVDLQQDGSADVTLTLTYDLGKQAESDAFQELRDDSQAREDIRRRFRDRMQSVAQDAENTTGRPMAVTGATVELSTTDGGATGVVTLTVTWDGLAAVEDGRLTVGEPFASGFESDRPFTVRAPDGYQVVEATPQPDSSTETSITYAAGTSLEGFQATFASDGDGATGTGLPGFGPIVALVAIVLVALRFR